MRNSPLRYIQYTFVVLIIAKGFLNRCNICYQSIINKSSHLLLDHQAKTISQNVLPVKTYICVRFE